MNNKQIGLIFIFLGIILLVISYFFWPIIFYALGVLIIGILIFFNFSKENEIEKIKYINKKVK